MKNKYLYQLVLKEADSLKTKYTFKQYMIQNIIYCLMMILASTYFKLPLICIGVLLLIVVILVPFIIIKQLQYNYNNHRFEIVSGYIVQLLFAFKMKPKILDCLKVVSSLVDKTMQQLINEATEIIEEDKTGSGYQDAFSLIEEKYPCNKVKALHMFLISVENRGGKYQETLDILLNDIHDYIKNVYVYQKELKDIKTKVILSIGLSVIIAGTMMLMVPSNLIVIHENILYIVATTAFFVCIIILFLYIQTRFSPDWLQVDSIDDEDELYKLINKQKKKEYASNYPKFILYVISAIITIIGVLFGQIHLLLLGIILCIWLYFKDVIIEKMNARRIQRSIIISFPIWIRDISLEIQSSVVPLAIKNSIETAPLVLKSEITHLSNQIETYPTSIGPYEDFLSFYKIPGVINAMKMLYTVKNLDTNDQILQIQSLIHQNQELLIKSQQLSRENKLAGLGLFVAVPMLLATGKLVVDLILLIKEFFSISGG